MEEFQTEVKEKGKKWVLIEGIIHDVEKENFVEIHPGGPGLVRNVIGKDATSSFQNVYKHSNAARNWLRKLRVGRISLEKKLKAS
jgi:stearoyl-CoA desaturase (delta-9 desaturase)